MKWHFQRKRKVETSHINDQIYQLQATRARNPNLQVDITHAYVACIRLDSH